MKLNPKEKEIITQLTTGRKTWTGLFQSVRMGKETLFLKLMKLMEEGIIEKYGVVEFGKIIDYYDLVKKKEPAIALKVPRMFEKGDFIFPLTLKEDLDVEQSLVQWFHHSLKVVMHFARKILDVRFAEELSSKRRIEYTENWIEAAKYYASDWMVGFIDYIIPNSDASWLEMFGTYEDDPEAFIKAMAKYSEIVNEAEKKEIEDDKVIEVNSEDDVSFSS